MSHESKGILVVIILRNEKRYRKPQWAGLKEGAANLLYFGIGQW